MIHRSVVNKEADVLTAKVQVRAGVEY
jgi:hypothetical protein